MKKTVFPALGRLIIFMVYFFNLILIIVFVLVYLGPDLVLSFAEHDYWSIVIETSFLVICLVFFVILAFCGLWMYLCFCRPVFWDETGIRQGVVFPQRNSWSDTPRVGMVSMVRYPSAGNGHRIGIRSKPFPGLWGENTIFVTDRDYLDNSMEIYGVGEVFAQMLAKKLFPKLYYIINRRKRYMEQAESERYKELIRSGILTPEIELPRTIICVRYTPERFSELTRLSNYQKQES